jgi:exodeoxyribonuclease VII small subunit
MSATKNDLNKKLAELEALVAWFEGDDIDIEQAVEKFEAGNKLAAEIRERLNTLENKITILSERFDQPE